MTGKRAEPKRTGRHRIVIAVMIILAAFLGVDLYYSNNVILRSEITLEFNSLPESFDGFTIVLLSDLHEKYFGEGNHKLLHEVELSKPDMIAITGDLIDDVKFLDYAEELCSELVKLAPVYYVTGNHEWSREKESAGRLKSLFRDIGVTVMDNKTQKLQRAGQSIYVAGLEDPNGRADRKTAKELVWSVREKDPGAFILLLCHRYEMFNIYKEASVELALTGHAHGGLIRLPFTDGLIAPGRVFFPKHTSGAYTEDGTTMVTSRGLAGAGGIAPRVFNRPDIPVITLKTAHQ